MPELIEQTEGVPSSYPAPPGDLSDAASQLDAPAIWKRIEDWISYRWGERSVEWIVRGPGVWSPPLEPYTIDTIKVERGDGTLETVQLNDGLLGYDLDGYIYRFEATVGNTDDPPSTVMEAYRRLAEYVADGGNMPIPATEHSVNVGSLSWDTTRPTAWKAKALHHSGAADLLRSYR